MKKTGKKVILYRIDGLDQQAAVLDGRLDALQTAVSGLAKRVAELAQEAADLELIRKRVEELEERVAKTEEGLYKEDPNVSELRGISEPTLTLRRRVHLLEDALITITRSKVVPGNAGWALSDAVDEYLPFRDGLPLDGRESKEALK